MFTTKPESGASVTKLIEGVGDAKAPGPATFASKSPRLSAGKMVPSLARPIECQIGKHSSF